MAGSISPSGARGPPPPVMSLEAALDEERLEVMAALEAEKKTRPDSPTATRNNRTATPPPVRSMLDVDTGPAPRGARHGSIAGIGVGITSPSSPPSKLNPADPSTWTRRHMSSSASDKPTSPPIFTIKSPDSTDSKQEGLPKIQDSPPVQDQYKFDMSSNAPRQLPLQAAPGGKRPREGSSTAMAAAVSGDFDSLHVGLLKGVREGRHNSTAGIGGKSRSPSSRIVPRPGSPALLSPTSPPSKITTDSGKEILLSQAYRKLSNKPGNSGSFSTIASESDADTRVPKDHLNHPEEETVESSDEDKGEMSSSDESPTLERGRRRARRKKYGSSDLDSDTGEDSTMVVDKPSPYRESQAWSQMAAAEEERVAVSQSLPFKSLLEPSEPTISITAPVDEKMVSKSTAVHPATSFDHATASAATSIASSDQEDADMADITKARKLGLNVSPLDQSVPDRVVRIILRGDWQTIQAEADDGLRRQRLYIVATDLSDEAVYALEWTIGTILRDGDTLLAFYAMGDETLKEKNSEADREALTAEGEKAARDAQTTIDQLTSKTTTAYTDSKSVHLSPQLSYQPGTETGSISGSVDARNVSKAQRERLHAVEDISSTCVRLLRKTRLQVRVCVEVVTCKSPKHLITGAIDTLDPTLVVLGSRGRSALKGVLLGSFSNYLVTKSSVPVMVARKKLKKHTKKPGGQSGVRLSNNLSVSGMRGPRIKLEQAGVESGRGKFRGMKVRS